MNLAVTLPHVASWAAFPDGSGLDVRADKIGRPAVRGLQTCQRWSGDFRWHASGQGGGSPLTTVRTRSKYLPQTDRIANHALGLSREIMEMSTA
jgi:hypothetical protein